MTENQVNKVFSILADLDDYVKSEQKRLMDRLEYYQAKYKEYEDQCETLAEELVKQTHLASYNGKEAKKWRQLYETKT